MNPSLSNIFYLHRLLWVSSASQWWQSGWRRRGRNFSNRKWKHAESPVGPAPRSSASSGTGRSPPPSLWTSESRLSHNTIKVLQRIMFNKMSHQSVSQYGHMWDDIDMPGIIFVDTDDMSYYTLGGILAFLVYLSHLRSRTEWARLASCPRHSRESLPGRNLWWPEEVSSSVSPRYFSPSSTWHSSWRAARTASDRPEHQTARHGSIISFSTGGHRILTDVASIQRSSSWSAGRLSWRSPSISLNCSRMGRPRDSSGCPGMLIVSSRTAVGAMVQRQGSTISALC